MTRLILIALIGLATFAYSILTARAAAAAAISKTANPGQAAPEVNHKKVHTAFDVPEDNIKAPQAQAVKGGSSMKQQLGNQVKSMD